MTTGQYIKELRLKKGMTQEELAAKTETTARTIQRIENDEVAPRAFTLQSIAAALEIDFEELNNTSKEQRSDKRSLWLPLLHLSGMFILLLPPLLIWIAKRNTVKDIDAHGRQVMNFQLSMLLYIIPCGLLAILVIPVVALVGLGIFSMIIVLINTIKVFSGQPCRYPLALNILRPAA